MKPTEPENRPIDIAAIVAVADDNAIGRKGDLLCHLPDDLKHFKQLTLGHPVVMGRRTYESFPRRPLPGRRNIVITRQKGYAPEGATVVHSLAEALQAAGGDEGQVFIIGGAQVYRQAMPLVNTLYLTRIHARFPDADTFFPDIDPEQWTVAATEKHPADERHPHEFEFITLNRNEI